MFLSPVNNASIVITYGRLVQRVIREASLSSQPLKKVRVVAVASAHCGTGRVIQALSLLRVGQGAKNVFAAPHLKYLF